MSSKAENIHSGPGPPCSPGSLAPDLTRQDCRRFQGASVSIRAATLYCSGLQLLHVPGASP